MNKSLTEYIEKFTSTENSTDSDFKQIFDLIKKENNLSSIYFKLLDSLSSKFLKNPAYIQTNKYLIKDYFSSKTFNLASKSLFDFCLNWLITLFIKLEENEEIFIKIIIENISNTKYLKVDKKNQLEDNPFYKILKNKYECADILNRISYFHEHLEKKILSSIIEKDKSIETKLKNKLLIIFEHELKNFGRHLYDFYIINIISKLKMNPTRFEIDLERIRLKMLIKNKYFDHYNYFKDILLLSFNETINMITRKIIFFVFTILIKITGITFLNKFIQYLNNFINQKDFIKILAYLEFSILNENANFCYMEIDSNLGFIKCIELLLLDIIGTHNLKFEKGNDEYQEAKIIEQYRSLKNLIFLFEDVIHLIKNNTFLTNVNLLNVYNFYYNIQQAFIKCFPIFDINKRRTYEYQIKSGKIQKVINKYEKTYKEISDISLKIISNFYNKSKISLIFQNWLIFFYKNANIVDSYKAIRTFLVTPKESGQIYTLLKLDFEVYKYFPFLRKIVLNSFLSDANGRDQDENYNLITNLKYMFYYEISLKIGSQMIQGGFYNSISYNKNVIIKFFREKFAILSSIFFSDDSFIQDIKNKSIDASFENYVYGIKNNIIKNDSAFNTKIEILNILSFLLNNYLDYEIINPEIKKFFIDLFELLVEHPEHSISDNIKNIMLIVIRSYTKNLNITNIISSPSRILFIHLIQHLMSKILDDNINKENKNKYFNHFLSIYRFLSNNPRNLSDLKNVIISSIKQLIYKNVDNQSFKNPIIMKNMTHLNDIDERIINKDYLVDLLELLDNEDHLSLYGYYTRYIFYSIKYYKVNLTVNSNLKKIFCILYKNQWLPEYFMKMTDIVEKLDKFNFEKLMNYIHNYMTEYHEKNNEEKNKGKTIYKILIKVMIIDNIKKI